MEENAHSFDSFKLGISGLMKAYMGNNNFQGLIVKNLTTVFKSSKHWPSCAK